MRNNSAFVHALAFAATLACVAPSFAQSSRNAAPVWVEPQGRFSLSFVALGWTAAPLLGSHSLLTIIRNDSPRDDRMRMCSVQERIIPDTADVAQATANARFGAWTDERLAQVVGPPVRNVARSNVQGVPVIDYQSERGALQFVQRVLLLAGAQGLSLVTIGCSTTPAPMTDEELASARAVLNSLAFLPAGAHANADWIDPSGRVALNFRALEWSALPQELAERGGYLLMLQRNDSPADGRPRICTVVQRASPGETGNTQAQINDDLDAWTADLLRQRLGAAVEDLQHSRIGSVSVLSYAVRMQGNDMRTRTFVLGGGGRATLFDLTCGAPAPAAPDELASMSALLNSLRIRE